MSDSPGGLLTDDDPPPFELFNEGGQASCLIVCDHANNTIPRTLNDLGLTPADLQRHIAHDIGAAAVARKLAQRLDAPLVLAGYSRLIIDPNRHPGSATSIPLASEDVVIPGNHDLSKQDRQLREQQFFWSYHDAIAAQMARFRRQDRVPAVVSLHSFTPAFLGRERPWHVGVLWHRDSRIALPLIKRLNAEPDLCVGDNEPYSARNPEGYTMEMHAERPGNPGVLIEIRQDLIDTPPEVEKWQVRLGLILEEILADPAIYYLEPRQSV